MYFRTPGFLQHFLGDVFWNASCIPDLSGKTFIVTGGNSGIGYHAVKQLAAKNARVIMAGRSEERCQDAIQSIREEVKAGHIDFKPLDLGSLRSVESFSERVRASYPPLTGLINNAGVQIPEGQEKTEDGLEVHMGTNFFGHFYLTHLLLDRVREGAPARILFMSSPEEARGFVPWDDLMGQKVKRTSMDWYGAANLCKLMVGKELARRLGGADVDVFVVQPGMTSTDIFKKQDYSKAESTTHNKMQQVAGQREEVGVTSTLYAATEPSLRGRSGLYVGPYYYRLPNWFSRNFPMTTNMFQTMPLDSARAEARDPNNRARLYEEAADALEGMLGRPLPNRLRAAGLGIEPAST